MKSLWILGISLIFHACQKEQKTVTYTYDAKNDSAVFYFHKGWEHIMDYGQWTLSERAFRKAVSHDSTFLIGKSLVGKITQNLEERIHLLNDLSKQQKKVSPDNQLLLEITLTTMKLLNARDQNTTLNSEFYTHFGDIGEQNYRKFVHKHPGESYIKAEYIEFLHAQHGAKLALDSLHILTSKKQKSLPFFISYAAILESEMGLHEKAIKKAHLLKKQINDSTIPSPYMLYAQIYADMDSLDLAKTYVEKAIQLDGNHVIAQRLQQRIEKELE